MAAEIFSIQMQNLISSLERFAVSIISTISTSRDFLWRSLGAQKCYVFVAKLIAVMTTKQTYSNLDAKD